MLSVLNEMAMQKVLQQFMTNNGFGPNKRKHASKTKQNSNNLDLIWELNPLPVRCVSSRTPAKTNANK